VRIKETMFTASPLHKEVYSMAFLDTSHTTALHPPRNLLSKLIKKIFDALISWNDTRVTRNILSQLSTRELNDIGLAPGDIERILRH
jgi:uncharacterized protein YjiS (DUF1127 family)|tara:strand:+ start:618 stop:878 length:261 start_codon:yes stop_codon:yes gene_type:complete